MSDGTRLKRNRCYWRRKFSGVAAAEFAVCLPLIVLLVFGSIEATNYIFLKQTLNIATSIIDYSWKMFSTTLPHCGRRRCRIVQNLKSNLAFYTFTANELLPMAFC